MEGQRCGAEPQKENPKAKGKRRNCRAVLTKILSQKIRNHDLRAPRCKPTGSIMFGARASCCLSGATYGAQNPIDNDALSVPFSGDFSLDRDSLIERPEGRGLPSRFENWSFWSSPQRNLLMVRWENYDFVSFHRNPEAPPFPSLMRNPCQAYFRPSSPCYFRILTILTLGKSNVCSYTKPWLLARCRRVRSRGSAWQCAEAIEVRRSWSLLSGWSSSWALWVWVWTWDTFATRSANYKKLRTLRPSQERWSLPPAGARELVVR